MAFSNALLRQDVARADAALRSGRDHGRAGARGSRRCLSSEIAACAELLGRLRPSASIAEAIVLAVYMPPHDPAPGHACCSRSASAGVATACPPRAAPPLRTPRRCRRAGPGRCRAGWCRRRRTPPGRLSRAIAITQAGMFLSQPPMATSAVEALGAHHGLDRVGDHLARHERVLHALGAHRDAVRHGDGVEDHRLAAGARRRPSAACRASASMCTLHGVTWLHVEQTPTCDFGSRRA